MSDMMINSWVVALIVSMWLSSKVIMLEVVRPTHSNQQPSEIEVDASASASAIGKKWAILVAGSYDFSNYRHQADVCHAYQILKKGGLKDENIIVFMYDDIAFNEENPTPGVIINKPNGPNVYEGVPKDYTRNNANAKNFYAVISGKRSAITGGSGKVVDSGPNDTIFIYYTDHGASGIIGMPVGDPVIANDFVNVLKKKHAANAYKTMVIYLEACEAGSMFEGLLPNNINIYATTASNASADSFAEYCPETFPDLQHMHNTCLGDVYSISWLEDSDKNDMTSETLEQQFVSVRRRTTFGHIESSSPVMQYGDKSFSNDSMVTYIGSDPANSNDNYIFSINSTGYSSASIATPTRPVAQRDAHLLYLRHKLIKAAEGSNEKLKAQKELANEIAHRENVDNSVKFIGDLLFGEESSTAMMTNVRPAGQPLVDDWDCYKKYMKIYESHCGALSSYGKKYSRAFANMCNAGISEEQMIAASSQACHKEKHASLIPLS